MLLVSMIPAASTAGKGRDGTAWGLVERKGKSLYVIFCNPLFACSSIFMCCCPLHKHYVLVFVAAFLYGSFFFL